MEEGNGCLKISSVVRAAITSHQEKFGEVKPATDKFQKNHPELNHSKARELHQAKKETDRFQRTRKLAESQAQNSEKLRMSNSPAEKVMIELESTKRELSRIKLDMASVSEEKTRAGKEAQSCKKKELSYTNSIEKLNKEIEEANEENVLVELARIEAVREFEDIESRRREESKKHADVIDAIRKEKNLFMAADIEDAKEMKEKLAITAADIDMLEHELKQAKVYEEGGSKFDQVSKKELASVREEIFRFMTSMDSVRNEIRCVMEETAIRKKREEKTEIAIKNLNAKLLRAKSKLESTSASVEKAKSMASNLIMTFEHLRSETESARNERYKIVERAAKLEERAKETEGNVVFADERILQELEGVRSSEASALEKLGALAEETAKKRSSMVSEVRISEFERDYLKGNAREAMEVGEKKVEACRAWVEALRASEGEILIRRDLLRREKGGDGGGDRVGRNEDDFEEWIGQKREPGDEDAYRGNKSTVNRGVGGKRGKLRRFSSPVIRGNTKSGSFAVRRRKR